MSDPHPISIAVVIGTARPDNYTSKAAALVIDQLGKDPEVAVVVVRPEEYALTFPGQPPSPAADRLRAVIRGAAGVVLATPEYHGSFSSLLKLTLENLGFPSVLAGKPVALLGVAAGAIGAIKSLEQLRSVCAHVGALALPTPISVADVQQVFAADGTCRDPGVEKRVRSVATNLLGYLRGAVCPGIQLERLLRERDAG